MDFFIAAISWTSLTVFSLYGWDLLVSLAGFLPLPLPATPDAPKKRFAILVCAHNEAKVVAGVVQSLGQLDYPRALFEIFVVADHCTDATAQVASQAGATVLLRDGSPNRTKGYALQWGMRELASRGPFDACCVFDADNVAMPNFLQVMNAYLHHGHVAIQAYLDTKNPYASWVSSCIALAYFITNRFWLRARARLGLATTLGGTGVCLAWPIVRDYPWDPGSLADDLDLTMKLLATANIRVSYCPHTRTYDEKPTTLRQSVRQRSRWMQGHNDVMLHWVKAMVKGTLTKPLVGPAACHFDALLHLLQPVRLLLAFATLLALGLAALAFPEHPGLRPAFYFTLPGLLLAGIVFVAYPLVVALFERVPAKLLLYMPLMLLYSFTWVPAVAVGLLKVRKRVWVHTTHG